MANFYDKDSQSGFAELFETFDGVLNKLCERIDSLELKIDELHKIICDQNNALVSSKINSETHDINMDVFPIDDVQKSIYENETLIQNQYYGAPSGTGFELQNATNSETVQSLYKVIVKDETHANFCPMVSKIVRFQNNIELFTTVCEGNIDIKEANSMEVLVNNYGELELEDGNYWRVVKRCIVNLKK